MASVSCSQDPLECDEHAEKRVGREDRSFNRIGSNYAANSEEVLTGSSIVIISLISVLAAVVIVGVVLLSFLWKKNKKEKLRRKEIERRNREAKRRRREVTRTMEMEEGKAVPTGNRSSVPSGHQLLANQQGTSGTAMDRPQTPTAIPLPEPPPPPVEVNPSILVSQQQPTSNPAEERQRFDNEGPRYEKEYKDFRSRARGSGQEYGGRTREMSEAENELANRKKRGKRKMVNLKYKFTGGYNDLGNIHPKHDFGTDESNQSLWDIVMVRLSLINDDFMHKSRYISGQPFGFKHDVMLMGVADSEWEEEEVDSYESGVQEREGSQ